MYFHCCIEKYLYLPNVKKNQLMIGLKYFSRKLKKNLNSIKEEGSYISNLIIRYARKADLQY